MSYVGLLCEYAVLNLESLRLKINEESKFMTNFKECILFALEIFFKATKRLIYTAKALKVNKIY
jgi:hypothetical protein